MKTRISTEWLSGCSGCHVAVVDLHEKILALVEDVEFVRAPVLMDEKGYPKAEVGLVEGAVRSEHDRQALLAMRESVDTLIAFGSCAAFGGPSGLGWLYPQQEVMAAAFDGPPTSSGEGLPPGDPPRLEASVVPIDEVVEVDLYLPGCPPHPYFIAACVKKLLTGSAPELSDKPVCSACDRKMVKRSGVALARGAVTAAEADICFLSQGVVCLGSVSLNRCLAPCPSVGVACTGCAGPSLDLLVEPHLDQRRQVSRRMHLLTGIERTEVEAYFEEDAKTMYAYALASPVVHAKPTVEMRQWAGRTAPAGS